MLNNSRPLPLVGALFAVVGIVGYVVFGWRFGGDSSTVANALAIVAVLIAIGATVWRRQHR